MSVFQVSCGICLPSDVVLRDGSLLWKFLSEGSERASWTCCLCNCCKSLFSIFPHPCSCSQRVFWCTDGVFALRLRFVALVQRRRGIIGLPITSIFAGDDIYGLAADYSGCTSVHEVIPSNKVRGCCKREQAKELYSYVNLFYHTKQTRTGVATVTETLIFHDMKTCAGVLRFSNSVPDYT